MCKESAAGAAARLATARILLTKSLVESTCASPSSGHCRLRPRRIAPRTARPGRPPAADRPGRAALRAGAAAALRRHRARRLVPDGGARGAGPRRHAFRQRGFGDVRASRAGLAAGPAPRSLLHAILSRTTCCCSRKSSSGPPSSTSFTSTWTTCTFRISRRAGVPHVTTLHGRLDMPDLAAVYREFRDVPVVSISNVAAVVPGGGVGGAPSTTGFRLSSFERARETGATSRFSGASLRRSGSTGRSRSPAGPARGCASPPRWIARTSNTSSARSARS